MRRSTVRSDLPSKFFDPGRVGGAASSPRKARSDFPDQGIPGTKWVTPFLGAR